MTAKRKLTRKDISHLADLANLIVPEASADKVLDSLEDSLEYVDNLYEVDISKVSETFYTTKAKNVWREDKIDVSDMLSQQEALKNAKAVKNGYFVVKRIL